MLNLLDIAPPDLTSLNSIGSNLVLILQAIGGVIALVGFALAGLMRMTAFGNEHKVTLAKTAAIDLVVGIVMLLGAPLFARILSSGLVFLTK